VQIVDVAALVIAIVGGLTGVSGLIISIRSDRRADKRAAGAERRAQRAEEDGARARERELWTELIRLPQWMTVEHHVINGMLEQTLLRLSGKPTTQQIENAHRRPNEWASSFSNNLRYARKTEPSAKVAASIEELIAAGRQH
jgi:hypothetical protein